MRNALIRAAGLAAALLFVACAAGRAPSDDDNGRGATGGAGGMGGAIGRTNLRDDSGAGDPEPGDKGKDASGGGKAGDAGERGDAASSTDGSAGAKDAGAEKDTGPTFDHESKILPILWIETGGKAIAAHVDTKATLKVVYEHEDAQLKDLNGKTIVLQTPITISWHGATSLGLVKKSYGIQFMDDKGMQDKHPFLDLPSGSDWVLHSCGQDRTCLRNALTYALSREAGFYAPRTVFTELYLDGAYKGLYVACEKIKQDNKRVDIPKPAMDTSGDITGGYIFKMDLGQGTPTDKPPKDWVSTGIKMVYSYVYPTYSQITAAQKKYLSDFVNQFEDMTKGAMFADPAVGYRKWIDVPSWVNFALFQELTNNIDAYQKSLYIQKWPKDRGDKLALGPLWDFDYAWGQAGFRDGNLTNIWAYKMNRFGTEPVPYTPPGTVPHVPAYWEKLWADAAFTADIKCRWQELRKQVVTIANIDSKINAWRDQLSGARVREMKLWPTYQPTKTDPTYNYLDPAEYPKLHTWADARIKFMDAMLPGTCSK